MRRAGTMPARECWTGLLLLLGAMGAWSAGHPRGEAAAAEKLTLGVSAVGAGQGGVLLAKEAGLFAQQGLEVEFVFFQSSLDALRTIVSGQLSVALSGGTTLINAVSGGAEAAWIAALVDTVPYVLVVSPEITRPADLKGKRLGINRFGTGADFAARFALSRLGLDPRADVTFLQTGDEAARLAALSTQSIQATLVSPGVTVVARRLGFRVLADVATLGLHYPFEAVVSTRRLIRERPDLLRRLLTGIVMGNHAFKTRRDDGLAVLRKYLKFDDGDALSEAYAVFSRLIQDKPYVSLDGVQLMLDELGASNARARALKVADLVEMRFVRELDDSGLLDRLSR